MYQVTVTPQFLSGKDFSTGSACIVMGSFNFCHIYFDVRT